MGGKNMATSLNPNRSDIGGASSNSAPQPTYKCPYCGSTKTEFWTKVYSHPVDKLDRWLDPEAVVTVATYYKCEVCGCLFEVEVKRLG